MRILLGTTNPSKVKRFSRLLSGYKVDLITLADVDVRDEPQETGHTPEDNARLKAAYYGQFCERVICNDSGLYIASLPMDDPRQPGLHVRAPQGVRLNDDEMIDYYAALAKNLGGRMSCYYLDGIAVFNQGRVESFMEDSAASRAGAFEMVDTPVAQRHVGWPLDSLSVNPGTGAYFVESGNQRHYTDEEMVLVGEYGRRITAFLAKSLGL